VLLANAPRVVPLRLTPIVGVLVRLIASATAAAIAGYLLERLLAGQVSRLLSLALGALTVAAVMGLCAGALGVTRNLRSPRAAVSPTGEC
jgi:hypothetical protein